MTAALFFVPPSPPGATNLRHPEGEGATGAVGLFALLLAGVSPLPAAGASGTQSSQVDAPAGASRFLRAALISVPADIAAAAPAVPAQAEPSAAPPQMAVTAQPADAASLPPTGAAPVQTAGEDHPPPLGAPVEQAPQSDVAEEGERTPTARHPTPHNPMIARESAPADEFAIRAEIRTAQSPPATQAEAALVAHVGSGRYGPIAPPWDARVPVLAELWTPSAAPRRAAGAPVATRDVASIATAGGTAGPNPAPARSNTPASALLQPVPDPTAEKAAAAVERGGLDTGLDAFDGPLGRAEQSAADPMRPAPPTRTAPPAPILQIGVQIAKAVPARVERLFVQLEPAALGRVEVRLEFHRDNQVSAVIAADRPDTLDALQRDARLLERSLHDAGLRLDSDDLTFSLKREQTHDQAREHAPFSLPADDAGDQAPVIARAAEPPPLRWFHGLRTLDIRI